MTPLAAPPSTKGTITRLAVARAATAGVDPGPLLRKAGLSAAQVQTPNSRMDAAGQVTFLNLVADTLHDDLLGFHLARDFEPREAGLLYFVLASSATLGDALARAERYSAITNESVRLWCQQEGGFSIRHGYVGVSRHRDRHQMEFWATLLVRLCQTLTATTINPVRVAFAHPRCGASEQLSAFFGCDVAFASGQDDVVFARHAAQLRLIGAEPYLNELLVRYCEDALPHRAGPISTPLRARVENALAPLLPHGSARAGEVARILGMSERTLARRLSMEGLTFAEIKEDMRKYLAQLYIADASLSISHIAWLLGFQEVSAFTHAFKRWTGLPPTQARIAHRCSPGL
ncbi:AraC family transcriptional regulator [Azospirillum canadense]|uniref:AraC family transcriptional regulator n=1 Tax=Azospirillum canadense TaxID=403962 RepID=UPI0022276562|nr:AraC family transcriptional regulator [Azospirillum canadense]MCW2243145.1 AraC-like DNA-binding protein [Azospirillum canadense]